MSPCILPIYCHVSLHLSYKLLCLPVSVIYTVMSPHICPIYCLVSLYLSYILQCLDIYCHVSPYLSYIMLLCLPVSVIYNEASLELQLQVGPVINTVQ